MIKNNSYDLIKVLGGAGALVGIIYAMKRKQGMGATAMYAAVFGIGGAFIGNAISKHQPTV